MAKVNGPLFSVEASGKIGDSLVFGKWRGINTVRGYTVPSNPQTAEQVRVRDNFSMAVAMWQALAGADQQAWNAFTSGESYSGFNNYVGRVKGQLDHNNEWANIHNVEEDSITDDSANIEATVDYDGEFRLRYGTTSGSYPNEIVMTQGTEESGDWPYTAALSGLNADTTYFYVIELMDGGDDAGRSGEYSFSTQTA